MRVWASQLVDLAAPQPGMRILDIACGTGIVTHQFAERISNQGQIVGYDISPEMLAVAQAKQSDTIIDWRLGDASHLPFEDQAFDIVTCQFGFMFFENRVANLQEMYRVLAPRGQLMILVWGAIERNPGFRAVAEGFERHVSAEAGNSIRGSFVMGDSQQMRDVVTAAGIQEARVQEVAAQAHFPSVELPVHGYGALLQAVIDEATHSRLIADVTAALQSYISQDGLVYPMAANLLYVRK
jgi:SAM-dependent methyltransferase